MNQLKAKNKQVKTAKLEALLRKVSKSEQEFEDLVMELFPRGGQGKQMNVDPLSKEEIEKLEKAAQGNSWAEVAAALGVKKANIHAPLARLALRYIRNLK